MIGIDQIGFKVLVLILLSASIVFAQENRCNLKVKVFESVDIISILEADITIRNLKTNETFDSKGQIKEFIFLNIPESDYEISARKENFKQNIHKFRLNCKNPGRDGYNIYTVILQSGKSKDKVETDERESSSFKIDKAVPYNREERLRKFAKINNLLNSEAVYLEKPEFPNSAKATRTSGIVYVKAIIDGKGNIESAQAISGHPLLRSAAEKAAKKAKFKPTVINEKPVKIEGLLVYSFVL